MFSVRCNFMTSTSFAKILIDALILCKRRLLLGFRTTLNDCKCRFFKGPIFWAIFEGKKCCFQIDRNSCNVLMNSHKTLRIQKNLFLMKFCKHLKNMNNPQRILSNRSNSDEFKKSCKLPKYCENFQKNLMRILKWILQILTRILPIFWSSDGSSK